MDVTALRDREDQGVNAVKDLPDSSKWAALETLMNDLKLRPLTQVNVSQEKIRAFKKECL